MQIQLKRAYAIPSKSDGRRILVDRLWPRGVGREQLQLDDWAKNIAPSPKLRKWFGHDPEKWKEFKRRYFEELDSRSDAIGKLLADGDSGRVTLIFGARDEQHNHAVALKEYLLKHVC